VLAWWDFSERDPVFFFETFEATFFVAMAPLNKMLFGLRSVNFGEIYVR